MTAPEPSAQALGERAVALINSYNNLIFTGDIHAGSQAAHADLLLLARAVESFRPRCERRPSPLGAPPAAFPDRIDRDADVERFASGMTGGEGVSLHGAEGVGKSYVARAALERTQSRGTSVWIDAASRSAGDALQGVFEAFFDAHPQIATPEQRRAAFADIAATVVFEDASAAAEGADQIRSELPGCTVALITREPVAWGGTAADVALEGLDPDDALELLLRDHPDAAGDRAAAERLIELLRGNPRRLRQAAGIARRMDLPLGTLVSALEADPEHELRRLLMDALEPEDRRIVEVLAGACGATLAVERLRALSGVEDAAARLKRMDGEATLQSGSPRYRLAGALAGLEEAGAQERVASHLAAVAEARDDPVSLLDELPAARALVEWAQRQGRLDVLLQLARAFSPVALFGRRWEAWGDLLRRALDAARRTGDVEATGWALHHLGTRAYLEGDEDGAVEALEEALELRRRIDDGAGQAATRHNLEFILGPSTGGDGGDDAGGPTPGGRGGGRRVLALAAVTAVLIAAGATLAGRGGDEPKQLGSPAGHDRKPPSGGDDGKGGTKGDNGRGGTDGSDTTETTTTGTTAVKVPPVKGLTRDEASRAIERAALTFEVAGSCGDGGPVVQGPTCLASGTNPTAGTRVHKGDDVVVTFSDTTKPPEKYVSVPALAGFTLEAANSALDNVGLRLVPEGSCDVDTGQPTSSPSCQVKSQDPPAGERVRPDTGVTATFYWNPPQTEKTTVPPVVGKTCAAALQAVREARLEPVGCQQAGYVVKSTVPAPGSTWDVGGRVLLKSVG